MIYRAIGVNAERQDLTIAFAEFHENAGSWTYALKANSALPSGTLHPGKLINQFIDEKDLQYKVALISVHTDVPDQTFNGAAIAAETKLPVITDLSAMDQTLGGNGEFFISTASKLQIQEDELNEVNKALCVAFMGVLRWREEYNFLSSMTGASRNSIGGAVWLGQEA